MPSCCAGADGGGGRRTDHAVGVSVSRVRGFFEYAATPATMVGVTVHSGALWQPDGRIVDGAGVEKRREIVAGIDVTGFGPSLEESAARGATDFGP